MENFNVKQRKISSTHTTPTLVLTAAAAAAVPVYPTPPPPSLFLCNAFCFRGNYINKRSYFYMALQRHTSASSPCCAWYGSEQHMFVFLTHFLLTGNRMFCLLPSLWSPPFPFPFFYKITVATNRSKPRGLLRAPASLTREMHVQNCIVQWGIGLGGVEKRTTTTTTTHLTEYLIDRAKKTAAH